MLFYPRRWGVNNKEMRASSYQVTVRYFCLEKVRKDIHINVNIFYHLPETVPEM